MHVTLHGVQGRSDLEGEMATLVNFDTVAQVWQVKMPDGCRLFLPPRNIRHRAPHEPLDVAREPCTETAAVLPREAPPVEEPTIATPHCSHFQPGERVSIAGLRARAELNGQTGVLVEFLADHDRWRVRMDDGTGKCFLRANLQSLADADASAARPGDGASTHPSRHREPGRGQVSQLLEVGMHVRVHSLKHRAELNGQGGELLGFDGQEQRWVVLLQDGTRKRLRQENLHRHFAPARSCEEGPQARLQGMISTKQPAAAILKFCEREVAGLMLQDLLAALWYVFESSSGGPEQIRMASCESLVTHSAVLLNTDKTAAPRDAVRLLEIVLHALPQPKAMNAVVRFLARKAGMFSAAELVRAFMALSRHGCAEHTLLDALAEALLEHAEEVSASIAAQVLAVLVNTKVWHVQLVSCLAERMSQDVTSLSIDELAVGCWSLSKLDALEGPRMEAMGVAVCHRASSLGALEVVQLAEAFASNTNRKVPIIQVLQSVAEPLVDEVRRLGSNKFCRLLDAIPQLQDRFGSDIVELAGCIGEHLRRADVNSTASETLVEALRAQLPADNLGMFGARRALKEIGLPQVKAAFYSRAASQIASSHEDRALRRCAVTEIHLRSGFSVVDETTICHDGQRWVGKSRFLLEQFFPDQLVAEARDCICSRAMFHLCERAVGVASSGGGEVWSSISGDAEIVVSEPPGLVGLLSLRHFQARFPGVLLRFSMRGEEIVSPTHGSADSSNAAGEEDPEVLDCDLDEVFDFDKRKL